MTNEAIQMTLLLIVLLGAIVLTLRAIYGLFTWKGARKKAVFQVIAVPAVGFVLLMIIAISIPETSPERAAAIAEQQAEREAREAAQAEARAAEAEARAQAEAEATAAARAERIAEIEAQREAAAAERVAQAEARAAELEACRQDLRCWGEKHSIAAGVRCRRPVERLAQYDMRWTDGWTEAKFPRMRWANQNEGLIAYIGDKAQFQNGFGAWQNVIYACTYDPSTDSAINVEVTPGRL